MPPTLQRIPVLDTTRASPSTEPNRQNRPDMAANRSPTIVTEKLDRTEVVDGITSCSTGAS
eukprot:3933726-Rhodomonas_salina.3